MSYCWDPVGGVSRDLDVSADVDVVHEWERAHVLMELQLLPWVQMAGIRVGVRL